MATSGTFLKPIFIAGAQYPVGAATIDDTLVSQLDRATFVPDSEPNPDVDNNKQLTEAESSATAIATAATSAHNDDATAHGGAFARTGAFGKKRAVLIGDSTMAGGNRLTNVAGTALSATGTTVTVTKSGHSLYKGAEIHVGGADDDRFNGATVVATIVSSSVFTFEAPVDFGATPVSDTASAVQIIWDHGYTDRNFFHIANSAIGSPFRFWNRAVSGSQTSYHLAHLDSDVAPLAPDLVVHLGYTNDVRAGRTASAIIANLTAIAVWCITRNIQIVLCTASPYDSNQGSFTDEEHEVFVAVTEWVRRYSRETAGVLCHDVFAIMADFSTTYSDFLADFVATSDYIHPSRLAHYRSAIHPTHPDLRSLLAGIAGNCQRQWVAGIRDDNFVTAASNNYCRNPLMQGTGGTLSGTTTGSVPDYWSVNNNSAVAAVASIEADPDGVGNALVVTLGGSGTGNVDVLAAELKSIIRPGERYELVGRLQGVDIGDVSSVSFFAQASFDGISSNGTHALWVAGTDTKGWQDDFDLTLVSPQFTVPEFTTCALFRPTLRITCAVAATGTYKLSQVALRKLN